MTKGCLPATGEMIVGYQPECKFWVKRHLLMELLTMILHGLTFLTNIPNISSLQ